MQPLQLSDGLLNAKQVGVSTAPQLMRCCPWYCTTLESACRELLLYLEVVSVLHGNPSALFSEL